MAVIREITEDSIHHYSDQGLRIRKVGTDEEYDEAFDVLDSNYEYEETEEVIYVDDNCKIDNYIEAMKIMLGEE